MPVKSYSLLFTIIIFVFIGIEKPAAQTQNDKNKRSYTYTIGANVFRGFIMKHDHRIGHLIREHPVGLELFINKNTYGKKSWQQLYNYPDIGFSLAYFDFKVPELGKVIASTVYLDFYLKRWKKSEMIFKVGTGLGFSTNPYDRETNNKNNVIGSTITFTLQGRLGYNFQINDRLRLTPALTISHFSNGAFKMPNKGINIISANLGFSYLLGEQSRPELTGSPIDENFDTNKDKKLHYNFSVFGGVREIIPIGGDKHPFINTVLYVDKKVSKRSALLLGGDFFYSWAVKQEIKTARGLEGEEKPDYKRAAITVGHELLVSKISLITQLGVYIYKPFKSSGKPVYQRYGLKYYFNDKLFSGVFLRAHYGVAQNVEWGLGIRL